MTIVKQKIIFLRLWAKIHNTVTKMLYNKKKIWTSERILYEDKDHCSDIDAAGVFVGLHRLSGGRVFQPLPVFPFLREGYA